MKSEVDIAEREKEHNELGDEQGDQPQGADALEWGLSTEDFYEPPELCPLQCYEQG